MTEQPLYVAYKKLQELEADAQKRARELRELAKTEEAELRTKSESHSATLRACTQAEIEAQGFAQARLAVEKQEYRYR